MFERRVRIFRLSPTAMQQEQKTRYWMISFVSAQKWVNPLMGWTSGKDTADMLSLRFASKDEAITFAELQGYRYEVEESHEKVYRPKQYASNYQYKGPAPKASHKHPYDENLDEEEKHTGGEHDNEASSL